MKKSLRLLLFIVLGTIAVSCERFLGVDLPTSLVSQEQVFGDDVTATSAIKGLYSNLIDRGNILSGSESSASTLTGLSADELHNYTTVIQDVAGFEQNNVPSDNSRVFGLWSSAYKTIYDANSAIEGLQKSTALTTSIKNQLVGEALVIRALCHFYLVNLFGPVPLITTIGYEANAVVTRASVDEVYARIESDLQEARTYLDEKYQGAPDRVRINKHAATALLARVYLYRGKWDLAENLSTILIENTTTYQLATEVNSVFFASSREAIWQLRLPDLALKNFTTWEGNIFTIQYASDINFNTLSSTLYGSFEIKDRRRKNWVGKYYTGADTIYYPAKFKQKFGNASTPENSNVIRLAEMYLIRAEARARLDQLSTAIDDLDAIRKRTGLTLIKTTNPAISKEDLLLAIEKERQLELFTEGAHRWFDLKRTSRANEVLGALKDNWSSTDELYPIPRSELINNKNLGAQNPGY